MAKLLISTLSLIKEKLLKHKRLAAELFLALLAALSVQYGITVHNTNKKLSDSLEIANNNIEAYLELVNNSLQASTVIKMDMTEMLNSTDKIIQKIDSVREENKIKSSSLTTAATETQSLLVSASKGVRGDIISILKDTIYKDTILYNNLTKVYYTIGKDTVNIKLDILNTQYLYVYKTREYKNKKSFIKRLFTLDFKKVDKYNYKIVNDNDLLNNSNIRIIEQE